MNTQIVSAISECVAGLGVDVAKRRFNEKIDERKLRLELINYIEGQRKYDELCTASEEIDFEGLVEYISNDFLDVVGERIFSPNSKERGKARREIVSAAIDRSKAETSDARQCVSKHILSCIDILKSFFERKHLSLKEYIGMDMIVDAIVEDVHNDTTRVTDSLEKAKNEIITELRNRGTLFSLDMAVTSAEIGDFSKIEDNIKKTFDHMSVSHPLYPDFGYKYEKGRIVSRPLNSDAVKQYPPKIVLTGSIKNEKMYGTDTNDDPLDYSYRHQIPIVMDISKAIKLIGEINDPVQAEAEEFVGKTLRIKPPEFPPPFPCSIKIDNETFFDYILMRAQEILDDGTFIIGNKGQKDNIYFEIRMNPEKGNILNYRLKLLHSTSRELLQQLRFLRALIEGKIIHIYVLSLHEDFVAGRIDKIDYKTSLASINEEIDFLERVCDIEDYFYVQFTINEDIEYSDYERVKKISDLIRKGSASGTWDKVTITGAIDQRFREGIMGSDEQLYALSYITSEQVNLFGARFLLRYMRTYHCVRMDDFNKTKRKVEVLDNGDEIKILLRAGDDNRFTDSLRIPEDIEPGVQNRY